MKKSLILPVSFTFLFLFSGLVSGAEPELKKEYWDNGNLKSETHYKKGKQEGLQTSWHENGRKKSNAYYKNWLENGVRTEWNEDGKKTYEGNFVNGNEE